jgi:hypothetical protein
MTFILNIVRKDFSLLAADKKATAAGPVTITIQNGPTIHVQGDGPISIHGFTKIFHNSNSTMALGIAGDANKHEYLPVFQETEDVSKALSVIRKHAEGFLKVGDRMELLKTKSYQNNQGMVTFFDNDTGLYYTNLFAFTAISNHTRLYVGDNNTPLFHIGSGSSVFEKAVGIDEINRFCSSVRSSEAIDMCLEWLGVAFRKVSEKAEGCGSEFDAVLSTRDRPIFQNIRQ